MNIELFNKSTLSNQYIIDSKTFNSSNADYIFNLYQNYNCMIILNNKMDPFKLKLVVKH